MAPAVLFGRLQGSWASIARQELLREGFTKLVSKSLSHTKTQTRDTKGGDGVQLLAKVHAEVNQLYIQRNKGSRERETMHLSSTS